MSAFRWNGSSYVNLRTGATVNPVADANFRPKSYASIAAARADLGVPSGTDITWNPSWTNLQQGLATLGADEFLWLPERFDGFGQPIPYVIDSSNGFMAAGVKEVDGVGANGQKDGSRVPIVSRNNLWFAMARAPRGIIGLGPGAVIEPSDSGYTRGPQPILQDQAAGNQFQLRYMIDGTTAEIVGVQEKLIECEHADSFFGNFELRGRDFGGVAYNGIAAAPPTGGKSTVKRVNFNGSWRGHAGVPNGETGGLTFLRAVYAVENCDFKSVGGPSPIMWNRTAGGSVKMIRSSKPNQGMWTYWRCGGVNTLEDVYMTCAQIGFNLEENNAGFTLNWTRGFMTLDWPSGNRFHLNINPSGGSVKVNFQDIAVSGNGYTPNTLSSHVYTTAGVQKRSDIVCNTIPISFLPPENWIA